MRTFIAIELNDELRFALERIISRVERTGADIKWVRPRSMHLTLKFLGEIDPGEGLAKVETALAGIVQEHAGFNLALEGTGVFPPSGRPRVFWAGLEDKPELRSLQSDLETALAGLGFPVEKRGFTPHLTLGRVRGPAGSSEAAEALEKCNGAVTGTLRVDKIVLFESILKPQGAEHRTIMEYMLK